MTWSADVTADDWKRISGAEIAKRVMSGLEAKSRGILLLHDIHERTVAALPDILKELKQSGYKVVQVVAANATIAKTETTPEQWRLPAAPSVGAEENQPVAHAASASAAAATKATAVKRVERGSSRREGAKHFRTKSRRVAGGHFDARHARVRIHSHPGRRSALAPKYT
jgi:hypothetical protein